MPRTTHPDFAHEVTVRFIYPDGVPAEEHICHLNESRLAVWELVHMCFMPLPAAHKQSYLVTRLPHGSRARPVDLDERVAVDGDVSLEIHYAGYEPGVPELMSRRTPK